MSPQNCHLHRLQVGERLRADGLAAQRRGRLDGGVVEPGESAHIHTPLRAHDQEEANRCVIVGVNGELGGRLVLEELLLIVLRRVPLLELLG